MQVDHKQEIKEIISALKEGLFFFFLLSIPSLFILYAIWVSRGLY